MLDVTEYNNRERPALLIAIIMTDLIFCIDICVSDPVADSLLLYLAAAAQATGSASTGGWASGTGACAITRT